MRACVCAAQNMTKVLETVVTIFYWVLMIFLMLLFLEYRQASLRPSPIVSTAFVCVVSLRSCDADTLCLLLLFPAFCCETRVSMVRSSLRSVTEVLLTLGTWLVFLSFTFGAALKVLRSRSLALPASLFSCLLALVRVSTHASRRMWAIPSSICCGTVPTMSATVCKSAQRSTSLVNWCALPVLTPGWCGAQRNETVGA